MTPDTRKFIEAWAQAIFGAAIIAGLVFGGYLLVTSTNKENRCHAAMQRAITGHDTTLVMIAGNCPVESR